MNEVNQKEKQKIMKMTILELQQYKTEILTKILEFKDSPMNLKYYSRILNFCNNWILIKELYQK